MFLILKHGFAIIYYDKKALYGGMAKKLPNDSMILLLLISHTLLFSFCSISICLRGKNQPYYYKRQRTGGLRIDSLGINGVRIHFIRLISLVKVFKKMGRAF